MPDSIGDLLDLLDLETLDVDLFRGRQPDTAFQRVFGGQVAAQALRAACATTEPGDAVHSIHSYFLRPGDTAVPIVYDVQRIRDGRSFATRRVMARQHGQPIYFLTASFQAEEAGFDHQDLMPDVLPPEECPTLGELVSRLTGTDTRSWQREWAALDVRYAADTARRGGIEDPERPARAQIWIRASGSVPDDPVVHTCVLTYASDLTLLGATLLPHGLAIGSPDLIVASLDHSVWYHRRFRADEWMLYDQHSPSASGGRGLALGRVFARDGSLIATVAQEGLIRPIGTTREQLLARRADSSPEAGAS